MCKPPPIFGKTFIHTLGDPTTRPFRPVGDSSCFVTSFGVQKRNSRTYEVVAVLRSAGESNARPDVVGEEMGNYTKHKTYGSESVPEN